MNRVLRLLCLLWAFLGISGQQLAHAETPGTLQRASLHAAVIGCDLAAGLRENSESCENSKPRKALLLSWMAAMGGTMSLLEARAPVAIGPARPVALTPASTPSRMLAGRHEGPEPEPPSL